jgi:thiol-disulfide isomerase/thioredoxin
MRFTLLLPVAFIFIVTNVAVAQDKIDYCEQSPAVKEDLRRIDKLSEEDLPYKVRRERALAMFQELLKKYPTDFHVQRRYVETRMGAFFADRDALVAEYRAQFEKNPNDPIATYLYARLLYGRNTKEVIKLATKLTQDAPQFPWPHLQLAEIYFTPNFRDPAKFKEHLKLLFEKCPNNTAGLTMLSRSGDKEMISAVAQRLRARLESSTDNDDLVYWDQLWTLEFKLKNVPEHPKQRELIAEDLKRIRARNLNTQQWLEALKAGYKQNGDKASERWAEDELARLLPKSAYVRRNIQSRFFDEHPYPKGESSEADRQAYHRAIVEVTNDWIKRWPEDEYTWSNRVRSLMALDGSSSDEVETAFNAYIKAHDRNGMSYSIPPVQVSVARFYLKHNYHLAKIPDMLLQGFAEAEQFDKNFGSSDLYPRPEEGGNIKYMHLDGWPLLAESYARIKQPQKAQAVLAQLADLALPKKSPETDAQKRSAAYNQTAYWQAVGKVADIEQRKLDALTAYQTAISFRVGPAGKEDELTNNAQRLWKELGGTDQGWKAYLARNEVSKTKLASAEAATWDSKNTALGEFELTDLEGRKWSHADLKGKVAFINFWATWCSPCRAELPYVQKLREQLKDRKDVVVLTLNTDEEVGKVEPFMKENKFTFPVLLGQAYADNQGINSIPRNWIISLDGKVVFEGIGFGGEGDEWVKRATQLIEKVKGSN